MSKKLFSNFIFIFITLFSINGISQDSLPNYMVSIVPQYFIVNGLRIDIDKQLRNGNHWLILSPQFYYKDYENTDNVFFWDNYQKVIGYGMDSYYKIFFNNKPVPEGVYFCGGVTLNYFELSYLEPVWKEVDDTGYFEYVEQTEKEKITTIGCKGLMGYQFRLVENLAADVFFGAGFKKSFISNPNEENTSRTIFNYGYSGMVMVFGFRLGFWF